MELISASALVCLYIYPFKALFSCLLVCFKLKQSDVDSAFFHVLFPVMLLNVFNQ